MSRKSKLNTQANALRINGTPALGTYQLNGGKNNPIGYYAPDKEKYRLLWTNYDFNQCCSRYVWENLPNGLESWNIERMLYYRGVLAGFVIAGHLYILPFVVNNSMLNIYGMPTRIKPIAYNGKPIEGRNDDLLDGFDLPVDLYGNPNDKASAVLLYDFTPNNPSGLATSRFYYNQILIHDIVDTLARVNINVVVSNKKILLLVKDPKQRDVVQEELEIAFGSDSPFAVITSELETQTPQSTSDYNADDLFNTIKNYDAMRCFMSGISSKSFGSEKKERLVSGELAGAEEEKDLILDMGLDMRKLFCDKINKKFGFNISVRKRADDYQDQINGRGLTQEEEEQNL